MTFPLQLTGSTLYSAASSNFLGTELVFQRHGPNPLKTETKRSCFNGKLLLYGHLHSDKIVQPKVQRSVSLNRLMNSENIFSMVGYQSPP